MLIEDGILVGYIQDRQNARLMGMRPTGNGRRQSYAHAPMPRMTNTYMLAGDRTPTKSSVRSRTESMRLISAAGRSTSPRAIRVQRDRGLPDRGRDARASVKGAMLIGNGPTDLNRISMIGNDLELDPGIGTCGKNGQGVPVGVGQPTLRIDRITVGGTG